MSEFDKPIKAKIVSVTTSGTEGVRSDSILVNFEAGGKKLSKDFQSPFLGEDNMRMWRQITLFAITGQRVAPDHRNIVEFDAYRTSLIGMDVFIGFDGEDIFAIGKEIGNLFFPDQYNLK